MPASIWISALFIAAVAHFVARGVSRMDRREDVYPAVMVAVLVACYAGMGIGRLLFD